MVRRTHLSRGFTLIELLVCIALVALLLAILLPALQSARATALLVKCGSHLRQLNIAANLYALDNDGYVTPNTRFLTSHGDDWQEYLILDGYLQSKMSSIPHPLEASLLSPANQVVLCPSASIRAVPMTENRPIWRVGNYGVNNRIGGLFVSSAAAVALSSSNLTRFDDISAPATKILYLDAGFSQIAPNEVVSPNVHRWLPGGSRNPGIASLPDWKHQDAYNGRHINTNINIAFADGHVQGQPVERIEEPILQGDIRAWDS